MITADEAIQTILKQTKTLGTEEAPLQVSLRRFLSTSIAAPIDHPPFDNSAMDGFAVRCRGTERVFKIVGAVRAGLSSPSSTYKLHPGEAVRIMTGAPLPEGTDTVIPFEDTIYNENICEISQTISLGKNIRRAGEDVKKGDLVLEGGEKISSRTIALLGALGVARVPVWKRPRVCIVATGNELVDVGARSSRPGAKTAPLQPGQIYNSNGPALEAALGEMGLLPKNTLKVCDSEKDLKEMIGKNLDADVLITVGGVSAGDYDLVPKILTDLGAKIIFHKVAIKPGKPLLFAVFENKLIFSLPGNPVSALMVFDRFVRPALLKMMGSQNPLRPRRMAIVESELRGTKGKEDYLRGVVTCRDGKYFARSAGSQGSARLLPLAHSNAILIIPETKQTVAAGELIEIEILEDI